MLLLFFAISAQAQEVPHRMTVAGVKVKLSDKLRKELQEEVDALTRHPRYFQIKVDRAKIYFPTIEKIFAEEGIPDDIKYLVLQESGLIPDAVSSSNAVGYWQFKDFTAVEVGLTVNRTVDERMHIAASSRGAAKYLKKNYEFFNNWIYAIQAYQMGAGGALKVVDEKNFGAESMDLDHKTYWYVKKFIAHKIAFEPAVNGYGEYSLVEFKKTANKTLEQVARDAQVDYEKVLAHNAWLRKGRIPGEGVYSVMIPTDAARLGKIKGTLVSDQHREAQVKTLKVTLDDKNRFPVEGTKKPLFSSESLKTFNNIPGIRAGEDPSLVDMAKEGEVSLSKFLKYNEVDIAHRPQAGQVYYFKRKKAKAPTHYHVVDHGETLWQISQRYGVRMSKLLLKNRLENEEDIQPGLVLWLRFVRPEDTPPEFKDIEPRKIIIPEKKIVKKKSDNKKTFLRETMDEAIDTLNTDVVDSISSFQTSQKLSSTDTIQATTFHTEEIEDAELSQYADIEWDTISHTVEARQTYYSISKVYNVSVLDLLEWNNINISEKLAIGQKLKILQRKSSDGKTEVLNLSEGANDEVVHEVRMGETMYQIARKYEVTVEAIMDWNSKTDYSLSPGEKLIIKQKN